MHNKENYITYKGEVEKSSFLTECQRTLNQQFLYNRMLPDEFMQNKLPLVLPLIQQWRIQGMQLLEKKFEAILKEISCISFPILKKLDLRGLKIQTMESIHRIRIPNLAQLKLYDNYLTTTKSLRKCSVKIKKLDLSGNKITSSDSQYFIATDAVDLEYMLLEWMLDKQMMTDCRWIVRLSASSLQTIRIESKDKINKIQLKSLIQKKYRTCLVNEYEYD